MHRKFREVRTRRFWDMREDSYIDRHNGPTDTIITMLHTSAGGEVLLGRIAVSLLRT